MIEAPAPCFFTVRAVDEAAQIATAVLSVKAAADIVEVSMMSDDFEYDISALLDMDAVVKQTAAELHEIKVDENFNPMFLPKKLNELDELLELQIRSDSIRFVGMDGNPFIIKTTSIKQDDSVLLTGKAQYHPFELPSYTDIVDADDQLSIN